MRPIEIALKHGPRAVADPQLGEDARDVVLHGPLRHAERRADLAVRIAAGEQAQHLHFAFGQLLVGLRLGLPGAERGAASEKFGTPRDLALKNKHEEAARVLKTAE
jgi:hypothetical protein